MRTLAKEMVLAIHVSLHPRFCLDATGIAELTFGALEHQLNISEMNVLTKR
jgi:hypothetical protein